MRKPIDEGYSQFTQSTDTSGANTNNDGKACDKGKEKEESKRENSTYF